MTSSSAPTPISVLLPMYNGEAYLAEQVRSILNQSGVDVRLFIVDDCSQDTSLTLARSLATADSRITVFENTENRGLIATLDRLLALVDTPYFSLSDQDDIWDPEKLRISVDFLESNGHELVYSDVRIVDDNGRKQAASYLTSRKIRPIEGRDPVPFAFRNPAIGHTIVARREVAEGARPIPGDLVFHEAWLVAVACSRGTVGFVSRGPLGSYRVHASNVVGPSRGRMVTRLARSLVSPRGWARRECTRAAALTALGSLDSSVARPAAILSARGASRLGGLPAYTAFLLQRLAPAGAGAVARELAAFLAGTFRRKDDHRSETACPGVRGQS